MQQRYGNLVITGRSRGALAWDEVRYAAWCCQGCGAEIGYLGRFFQAFVGGLLHSCTSHAQRKGEAR